jgi:hypothetical protein
MTRVILTQEMVQEELKYDPEIGQFFWRMGKQRRRLNKVAGCANKDGYIVIWLGKKLVRAHRLAWIYVYGEIPKDKFVDHINRDRSDNRIQNLRLVTPLENTKNRSESRKNSEPRNTARHQALARKKISNT